VPPPETLPLEVAALRCGDFTPVDPKHCPLCHEEGEWPGQPCPTCKENLPTVRPLTPRERLIHRNRRLRSLLADALTYLERPYRPETDLGARAVLAGRIREETTE
jgi:hypothetical protein